MLSTKQVQKLVSSDALAVYSFAILYNVDIVDNVNIVDIVAIVAIVDIVDIVVIVGIVDIVDIDHTIY